MINMNKIFPNYSEVNSEEMYSGRLDIEYLQCCDEGLDISELDQLFKAVSALPASANKERLADVLFDYIVNSKTRSDYEFNEPSDYKSIVQLSQGTEDKHLSLSDEELRSAVAGAWYGRLTGCLLGKSVEGIRTDEFYPFLKETGNYPLKRYILSTDINDEIINKYKFGFGHGCYADKLSCMPVDDDTNYTVFSQYVIDKYGKNFTSDDLAEEWQNVQAKNTYFTAERVAYINFTNGFAPPESAIYKNPFREWIGAQIRGDYFGYINPGCPKKAAEMAFRDARISHIKNGIYGEMFASAMIASSFTEKDPEKIIKNGLAQIPSTSRLHSSISSIIDKFNNGADIDECIKYIHSIFNEHLSHHWCHTISNAMIVAASLLYGNGNFDKSVCYAVQAGFDTDCNGATVGSIAGIINGIEKIDAKWIYPFNDTIETYMHCAARVRISDCIDRTLKHIAL